MSRTQKPVGLQQETKEAGLMGLRELASQRIPPPNHQGEQTVGAIERDSVVWRTFLNFDFF